jgi:integrase/recombinase XerD
LEKNKNNFLFPHQLTSRHINDYCLYLADSQTKLKPITRNYYLIALRAFLGYFAAKGINCIPLDIIRLPRAFKSEKRPITPNEEQIRGLLSVINTKTPQGLRDRSILELLMSTGIKIGQLILLNKDYINKSDILLSEQTIFWIKEYLKTRNDQTEALFINYRSRKAANKRLTCRSVQRLINFYGKKAGIMFPITPEILRWANVKNICDKVIDIKNPATHISRLIEKYQFKSVPAQKTKSVSPTWQIIENFINEEKNWLKNNTETISEKYNGNPPFMKYDDEIFRKIAILIVSGKIQASELYNDNGLWKWSDRKSTQKTHTHGKEWHAKMMDTIKEYFSSQGCTTLLQPPLNYGRADIGVTTKENKKIFAEIGTVSIFKLWYNFSTMKNVVFIVAPNTNKILEFIIND